MSVLQAITHPADTRTMRRNVLNIGILIGSAVHSVLVDEVPYQLDRPQREPGYYVVELDESEGLARLSPTRFKPGDRLVRRAPLAR
jgi:hypothetical protein